MKLNKAFLIAAFLACLLSLLLQLGTAGFLQTKLNNSDFINSSKLSETAQIFPQLDSVSNLPQKTINEFLDKSSKKPPGIGISFLAMLELLVILSLGLMVLSTVIGARLQGLIQGGVTLLSSLVVTVTAFAMLFMAIGKLTVMVSLFSSPPFGTLAYVAGYGSFKVTAATATLGLLLLLKMGLLGLLILANPRFLQNKGIVWLIATTIVAIFITAFLHGIVPGILVSIADAIAAIITAILVLIWSIFFIIFSFPGIIRAFKSLIPL